MSMVRILEGLGHTLEFPEEFTCCGQPPFNSGYWEESRAVAVRNLDIFKDAEVLNLDGIPEKEALELAGIR
ncbi:MAG: heterodisulfide reductase-related iron-sulfur binding cluster [Akkermansiaceae bacterium]|nr:heterodisulfide reductase-related iron-sulfur binding cluster [Akkermansiaceae bacterium]